MTTLSSTISVMGEETQAGIDWDRSFDMYDGDVTPLAYSETVELPEQRRWHTPAALFTIALLALCAAGAGWFLLRPHLPASLQHWPAQHTTTSTRPAAPAAAQPAPTASTSGLDKQLDAAAPDAGVLIPPAPPVDHDALYIDDLVRSNIGIANRGAAIELAHEVCTNMAQGYSWKSQVAQAQTRLNWMQAQALVDAAIGNYCPQYMNRIGD
jgi:hypothetical protein